MNINPSPNYSMHWLDAYDSNDKSIVNEAVFREIRSARVIMSVKKKKKTQLTDASEPSVCERKSKSSFVNDSISRSFSSSMDCTVSKSFCSSFCKKREKMLVSFSLCESVSECEWECECECVFVYTSIHTCRCMSKCVHAPTAYADLVFICERLSINTCLYTSVCTCVWVWWWCRWDR